ncbi:hypothetical protein [Streptomyces sp. NPDC059224]|uniref:hypothetical protein n=1 Tax=Streptomyces sp. NPDC059224 TaxID=3346775 RepID=UPI0036CFB595
MDATFETAHRLQVAAVRTGPGTPVVPTVEAVPGGIAGARVTGAGNDLAPGAGLPRPAGAYRIVLVTYEVVCESGNGASVLPTLDSFLAGPVGEAGQDLPYRVGCVPVPDGIAARAREVVAALS